VTQSTERGAPLSSASAVDNGRAAALTNSFLRGAIAAGLGLGALAVLVMALWISSPYPDTGADAALHVAAGLWLLAHGVELVRPDTLSGIPAPFGVVPLLLMALPASLAYRAARDILDPAEGRPQLTALGAVCTVVGGYLLVGGAVVLYTAGGPLTARPLRAALTLPVLAVLSAAVGAWAASGRPRGPLPRWLPRGLRTPGTHRGIWTALRSGTAGALVMAVGGVLIVGVALAWHADPAQASFMRLAGDWSGRFALLLLGLALLPNAAIWGAAYGLGPGFALGSASAVTPFGFVGSPVMPPFPLLAAVPGGYGTALHWATAAVPAVAGPTVAWFTLRVAAPPYAAREEAWGARETALGTALGSAVCAALMASLAAMSGGALGNGRLTDFGPVWWLTGAATLGWTVGLGVPTALLLRAWRLRERRAKEEPEAVPEVLPRTEETAGPAGGAGVGAAAAESATPAMAWWRLPGWWLGLWSGVEVEVEAETREEPPGSRTACGSGGPDLPDGSPTGARESRESRGTIGPEEQAYDFPLVEDRHGLGAGEARRPVFQEVPGGLAANAPATAPGPAAFPGSTAIAGPAVIPGAMAPPGPAIAPGLSAAPGRESASGPFEKRDPDARSGGDAP
jgi:hypothetical protein